jgi:tyrosinase
LTQHELDVYKHAIQIVKQRSAMDPNDRTGYDWQVRIHGSTLVGPCKHNTELIWPWHRAMLFYFEETLRATDPDHPTLSTRDVTIPYWDWTKQPTGAGGYPAAFEDISSSLFHPGRNPWDPSNPPPVFTDADTGLDLSDWGLFGGTTTAAGKLEYLTHNAGHGLYVGGDMGFTSTSPKDPIFWSHHANLDRLWDLWQQTYGVNPIQQTAPLRGWPATVSPPAIVSSFNDIRGQLGYDYCNPPVPQVFELALPSPSASPLSLPVGGGGARRSTAQIRLTGVSIPADRSYTVRVYLHPADVPFEPQNQAFARAYLAGRFVVWANDITDHGESAKTMDLNLEVSRAYEMLAQSGIKAADLKVSFDFARIDKGKLAPASFNSPGIGFESVRLVLNPDVLSGER